RDLQSEGPLTRINAEAAVKIRFEITLDDMLAFNRFHFENSAVWRKQREWVTWTMPGVCIILMLLHLFVELDEWAINPFFWGSLWAFFLALAVGVGLFCRWRVNVA